MVGKQFAEILGLGTPELIIILVILLLLFGGSKLPQLAKSLGSSMKELRKGMQDGDADKKQQANRQNTEEKA